MEIERNLKLVSTRRRRFSLSRYMGWLRYIASLPRVGRIVGVHYVTNSTSLDAKRSSLFKNIKMGTTTSICPVICFVFFCIFNGISSKEEKRANKDTVIMVSLDGMWWQFISGQFAGTPNLDAVGRNGVRAKHTFNVVPTKTWPTHHSYLTGLYPESHGIVSNKFWDPLYQEMYIYDYDCSSKHPKFYKAAEPIWLTLQKQGGKGGLYFWPGEEGYTEKPTYNEKPFCLVNCSAIDPKDLPKYRNRTRPTWPSYIHCFPNYTEPFKSRLDKVINWLKSEEPPQFVGVYIDHPDWEGHDYGSHSKQY